MRGENQRPACMLDSLVRVSSRFAIDPVPAGPPQVYRRKRSADTVAQTLPVGTTRESGAPRSPERIWTDEAAEKEERKGGKRRKKKCGKSYRYTVTTRMIPELRWAAMRAILMFQ